MAKTYYLSSTNSDLTGGADFSKALAETTSTASTQAISIAASATETSYGWTPSTQPGTNGATGNYTVELNVTSGNTAVLCAVSLSRVNSAGTAQSTSTATAEQTLSAGVKTYTFTSLSLGTWASGDRLRVNYAFRNSNSMTAQSVTIEYNTANADVATPFWPPVDITASGAASSAGSANLVLGNNLQGTSSGSSTSTGTASERLTLRAASSGSSLSTGSADGTIPSSANSISASGASTSTGSANVNTIARLSASGASVSTGSVSTGLFKQMSASGAALSTGVATIRMSLCAAGTGSSLSDGSVAYSVMILSSASAFSKTTGYARGEERFGNFVGWGIPV